MKHAYLILAHNEFWLLQTLIDCLDDPRNDIYVHIDQKVDILPELHTTLAGLKVIEKRIDIRWGGLRMVEAEFALFEEAAQHGPYQYYHLLSGVDLPIKCQDYIHAFCDANAGKEFIGYTLTELTPELIRRTQRWHLFPEHFGRNRSIYSVIRSACIKMQELLHIRRNRNIPFKKGSQWVSITENMVRYLLARKDWVYRTFRNTFVPDESVMQTLAWMSPYRENLFNIESDSAGCMRCIGWRIDPATNHWLLEDWASDDFDILASSSAFFARKFNSIDKRFIERIVVLSKKPVIDYDVSL